MRIRTLRPIAFGHPSPPGLQLTGDGLHIIHGPNEAGKTTTMRAIRALVRGLQADDPAPLPLPRALIEAEVALGEASYDVLRKGADGAGAPLRGPAAGPLPEAVRAAWPRLSPTVYDNVFCLDHDTLRRGGSHLQRSDSGELGTILFSTIADAARLADAEQALARSQAELFSPAGNATKPAVNRGVAAHRAAGVALREAEIDTQEHHRRRLALGEAGAQRRAAEAQLRDLGEARDHLVELKGIEPALRRLRELAAQGAALQAEGPAPSAPWASTVEENAAARARAAPLAETARREAEELEVQLAQIDVDAAIVEKSDLIRGAGTK
jgi:uncharacterized protein YhaN